MDESPEMDGLMRSDGVLLHDDTTAAWLGGTR
jgi:hypothetical protein